MRRRIFGERFDGSRSFSVTSNINPQTSPVHRFYLAPEDWNPDSLVLAGAEAHHARDVLRLQPSVRVVVFNGRGQEITE
jgi:hypothetical protein